MVDNIKKYIYFFQEIGSEIFGWFRVTHYFLQRCAEHFDLNGIR